MTPEFVIQMGQEALLLTVLLAAPILGSALAIGLFVGVFQAATQIQEQTLSFIPKLGAVVVSLLVAGPWMIKILVDFTVQLFESIPAYLG
jgi:flagellar biosynthesis protein FliQ